MIHPTQQTLIIKRNLWIYLSEKLSSREGKLRERRKAGGENTNINWPTTEAWTRERLLQRYHHLVFRRRSIAPLFVAGRLIKKKIVSILTYANATAANIFSLELCSPQQGVQLIAITHYMHSHQSAVTGTHPFYKISHQPLPLTPSSYLHIHLRALGRMTSSHLLKRFCGMRRFYTHRGQIYLPDRQLSQRTIHLCRIIHR